MLWSVWGIIRKETGIANQPIETAMAEYLLMHTSASLDSTL